MPSRHPVPPLPSTPARDATHAVPTPAVGRRELLAGALAGRLAPTPSDPPAAGAAAAGTADDAELLRECALVQMLDAEEVTGDDDRWAQALLRISRLRPGTLAGLHGKTRLALLLTPFGAAGTCPAWVSPDERLTWSLLRDLLALSEP